MGPRRDRELPALAASLRRTFGPIYGLVNNAAIGTAGILSTMPDMAIEQLVRMNVTSPLTLTKYLVRPMMAARAGRIVNVSSIVSVTGYSGLSAYSATKAALLASPAPSRAKSDSSASPSTPSRPASSRPR